jgi:hypothetical protein
MRLLGSSLSDYFGFEATTAGCCMEMYYRLCQWLHVRDPRERCYRLIRQSAGMT